VGDFDDIEHAADWPTANEEKYPRGAFASALVMTGFVDTIVQGKLYAIHDWYDHLPHFAKQRLSRMAKEDATIGRETYFVGLEAWIRRAAEAGIEVDIGGETTNRAQTGESDTETDSVSASHPGETQRNGLLSSRVESRRAERSEALSLSNPPTPLPFPPDPAAVEIWNRALELLRTGRPVDEIETWISPLRAESIDGSTFRLRAPNARFVHRIQETELAGEIAFAISIAADRELYVSLSAPAPTPQPTRPEPRRRRERAIA